MKRQRASLVRWAGPNSGRCGIFLAIAVTILAIGPGFAGDHQSKPPPPKFDLMRVRQGPILVTAAPEAAQFSFDEPKGRIESAGDGAARAARAVTDTPNLGNPYLEAAAGVVEFAASPFAAAYGAISSGHSKLPSEKLVLAEQQLTNELRAVTGGDDLRDSVVELARERTRRQILNSGETNDSKRRAVALLEVKPEQLRLIRDGSNDKNFLLWIEARARLTSVDGGRVLFERRYEYRSEQAMFIDWTEHEALAGSTHTGYRDLARQIAADIFQPKISEPLLLGPGQKKPQWPQTAQRRGALRFLRSTRLQFVSYESPDTASIEIYSGKAPPDVLIQKSKAGARPDAEPGTQTEYGLDGLANDRNSIVQAGACLAAIPFGLWEQTFGAVLQHRQQKTEETAALLRGIVRETQPQERVGAELARTLRSKAGAVVTFRPDPLISEELSGSRQRPVADAGEPKVAVGIELVDIQLTSKSGSTREALLVTGEATIYRTSDGQELYKCPVRYLSSVKKAKAWNADGGRSLRDELDRFVHEAGSAIANRLMEQGLAGSGSNPHVAEDY